jgi:hypothetical protein
MPFGLQNEPVHHILAPKFFILFAELNELICYYLIPRSYLVLI